MLRLEPALLSVLEFDLLILHPEAPLTLLSNEFYLWRRRRRQLITPETVALPAETAGRSEDERFVHFLGIAQQRCEELYRDLYTSNAHFLYTPAEISSGIFSFVFKHEYGYEDIDEFLLSIQPEEVRTNGQKRESFQNSLQIVQHAVFEFVEFDKDYDPASQGPKVNEIMTRLRKWIKTLNKKKRIAAGTDGDTAAKRSKSVQI